MLYQKQEFLTWRSYLTIAPTKRVVYTIYEYDPLLDSSNMTMDDWIFIAKDIEEYYQVNINTGRNL